MPAAPITRRPTVTSPDVDNFRLEQLEKPRAEAPADRMGPPAPARPTTPATPSAQRLMPGLQAPKAHKARMVPPAEFRAMGMTERRALELSGDPKELLTNTGSVFGGKHEQGDMGNRFGHATVSQVVSAAAEAAGVPQLLADAMGAAVFVYKENFYDLHASISDYVFTTDLVRVDRDDGRGVRVNATVFGDKAVFVGARAAF